MVMDTQHIKKLLNLTGWITFILPLIFTYPLLSRRSARRLARACVIFASLASSDKIKPDFPSKVLTGRILITVFSFSEIKIIE